MGRLPLESAGDVALPRTPQEDGLPPVHTTSSLPLPTLENHVWFPPPPPSLGEKPRRPAATHRAGPPVIEARVGPVQHPRDSFVLEPESYLLLLVPSVTPQRLPAGRPMACLSD